MSTSSVASDHEESELTIRGIVEQAISRLNQGDITAFEDFWREMVIFNGR